MDATVKEGVSKFCDARFGTPAADALELELPGFALVGDCCGLEASARGVFSEIGTDIELSSAGFRLLGGVETR